MGFRVYDSRSDLGSVFITPEMRSCFSRWEPGKGWAGGHTHDLGHELFLVLEGRAEFDIDGDIKELAPGQFCVALAGQTHYIRVLGDKPVFMYYCVTPHVQPTHTQWTEPRVGYDTNGYGDRISHAFSPGTGPTGKFDRDDTGLSNDELLDRHIDAFQSFANSVQVVAGIHKDVASNIKEAIANGDKDSATKAKKEMWDALFPVYKNLFSMTPFWNDLSTR